jgi:hypothetical protein
MPSGSFSILLNLGEQNYKANGLPVDSILTSISSLPPEWNLAGFKPQQFGG